jgi:DNA-binding GntR family transcriptional regulator
MHVSRAPVRQAIVVLEREGLILTDRLRGAIVAPLDIPLIHDLYQFRGTIERDVAETLARRSDFDPAEVRGIVKAGNAAAPKNDRARLIELDLRFHTGLYDAVGNRVLSQVMRGQWAHIRRVMAGTLAIEGYPRQVWQEHSAILEAIETHDVSLAGSRAAAHTEAAARRLIQSFTGELASHSQTDLAPRRRRVQRRRR